MYPHIKILRPKGAHIPDNPGTPETIPEIPDSKVIRPEIILIIKSKTKRQSKKPRGERGFLLWGCNKWERENEEMKTMMKFGKWVAAEGLATRGSAFVNYFQSFPSPDFP